MLYLNCLSCGLSLVSPSAPEPPLIACPVCADNHPLALFASSSPDPRSVLDTQPVAGGEPHDHRRSVGRWDTPN